MPAAMPPDEIIKREIYSTEELPMGNMVLFDLPRIGTAERHIHDIKKIESLARAVLKVNAPLDPILCEAFERLVELAGTRDFTVGAADLEKYTMYIAAMREDPFGLGYVVPWHMVQRIGHPHNASKNRAFVGAGVGLSGLSPLSQPQRFPVPAFDTWEVYKMKLYREGFNPNIPANTVNDGLAIKPESSAPITTVEDPFRTLEDPTLSSYEQLPYYFDTYGRGAKAVDVYVRFLSSGQLSDAVTIQAMAAQQEARVKDEERWAQIAADEATRKAEVAKRIAAEQAEPKSVATTDAVTVKRKKEAEMTPAGKKVAGGASKPRALKLKYGTVTAGPGSPTASSAEMHADKPFVKRATKAKPGELSGAHSAETAAPTLSSSRKSRSRVHSGDDNLLAAPVVKKPRGRAKPTSFAAAAAATPSPKRRSNNRNSTSSSSGAASITPTNKRAMSNSYASGSSHHHSIHQPILVSQPLIAQPPLYQPNAMPVSSGFGSYMPCPTFLPVYAPVTVPDTGGYYMASSYPSTYPMQPYALSEMGPTAGMYTPRSAYMDAGFRMPYPVTPKRKRSGYDDDDMAGPSTTPATATPPDSGRSGSKKARTELGAMIVARMATAASPARNC
ncbi:hypothetical protein HDU86_003283 [Geranomyces michiganensis]|nr:hypothetical protein HDU86_003283 [Geranomyces michiganensis]